MIEGLYYFDELSSSNKKDQVFSSTSSNFICEQIMLWYRRLGHPSFPYLKHLFLALFKNIDCLFFHYESCYSSKSQHAIYLSKPYFATKPFYLIHSDVSRPSQVTTSIGKKWFVTFIDDHTCLCWIYLMREKIEVEKLFKEFYTG